MLRMRVLALLAVTTAMAMIWAAPGVSAQVEPKQPSDADALAIRAEVTPATMFDRAAAWVGLPHQVEVEISVTNRTPRTESDLVASVRSDGRQFFAPPMAIAAGETTTVALRTDLGARAGSSTQLGILARDASIRAEYRAVPWLLLAGAMVLVHVALLHCRDLVRRRLERAGALCRAQPSPSQTWARSSRYSETS